jgi:hypothetical protein
MKLADFHKMLGITNEEQRKAYYRIHMLGIYSCMHCDEIIFDLNAGCPTCGKDELVKTFHDAPPSKPKAEHDKQYHNELS